MKRCPYCAEEIQDEAIVCRYCGRSMTATITAVQKRPAHAQLETAEQRYLVAGYDLVSRLENTVILERRAPLNVPLLIGLLLWCWPAAIIYAIPSVRKLYRLHLRVGEKGRVTESGDTPMQIDRDQDTRMIIGWVLTGAFAVLILLGILCSVS
jgi:hypothetical protein